MDEDNPRLKKHTPTSMAVSKLKRRILRHVFIVRTLSLVAVFLVLFFVLRPLGVVLGRSPLAELTSLAKSFVFPGSELKSLNGRTNVLMLGKGGAGHEAADLTDTMILASISSGDRRLDLISLPRDVWITDLRAKLNSVYYWGNQRQDGGGVVLAKSSVEQIVGIPVHYAIVFDFVAFTKIIDIVGPIQVDVQNAFVDERFPIPGKENDLCDGDKDLACRYETISFAQGVQSMDSATALKFVRSRSAEGDEGTDFARSARQQEVVDALIRRITQPEVLFSPTKVLNTLEVVFQSLETGMTRNELAILARHIFNSRKEVSNHSFPQDILVNPKKSALYDNLYVLVPASGDWSEVQAWVAQTLGN